MYIPSYSKRFVKQLKKIPKKEQIKILKKITKSLQNPMQSAIKLETTKPPIYRLRTGEYRVFFELDDLTKTMVITDVVRRTTQTYR